MYPFVQFASRGSIIAARIFPEPHERALYQIALGNQAYLQAASLVNKSYSLGVGKDEKGALRLENRQLLTAQLDEARRRALHAAARCQQVLGFIPSTCKVQYQLGVAYREGDDEQKLLALDSFWGATRSADIALLLAK